MIYLFKSLIFIFMFFVGMFTISSKRKNLLLMLLSLKFIILFLFMLNFIFLSVYDFAYYFSMMFIVFCVCESVLGLSVLVSLIWTHGNDFFNSIYFMLFYVKIYIYNSIYDPLCFKKNGFWLSQNYYFFMSFMFLVMGGFNSLWSNISYFFGSNLSMLSFGLILLSLWICSLMIMIMFMKKVISMIFFLLVLLFLMFFFYCTFSSMNLLMFFFFLKQY